MRIFPPPRIELQRHYYVSALRKKQDTSTIGIAQTTP